MNMSSIKFQLQFVGTLVDLSPTLVQEETLKMGVLVFVMFLWVFQQESLLKARAWRGFSDARSCSCETRLWLQAYLKGNARFIWPKTSFYSCPYCIAYQPVPSLQGHLASEKFSWVLGPRCPSGTFRWGWVLSFGLVLLLTVLVPSLWVLIVTSNIS